jgi:hypothetical protein
MRTYLVTCTDSPKGSEVFRTYVEADNGTKARYRGLQLWRKHPEFVPCYLRVVKFRAFLVKILT